MGGGTNQSNPKKNSHYCRLPTMNINKQTKNNQFVKPVLGTKLFILPKDINWPNLNSQGEVEEINYPMCNGAEINNGNHKVKTLKHV